MILFVRSIQAQIEIWSEFLNIYLKIILNRTTYNYTILERDMGPLPQTVWNQPRFNQTWHYIVLGRWNKIFNMALHNKGTKSSTWQLNKQCETNLIITRGSIKNFNPSLFKWLKSMPTTTSFSIHILHTIGQCKVKIHFIQSRTTMCNLQWGCTRVKIFVIHFRRTKKKKLSSHQN